MKRLLPLLILILIPLSFLTVKPINAQEPASPSAVDPFENYTAQPGDSLWSLAESKVPESENKIMVVNTVKNLEIMLNNLDDTNFYLEIGQSYKLLTQTQINYLTSQVNPSLPENAAYLIANPTPQPDWNELRQTAQPLSPNIVVPLYLGSIPSQQPVVAVSPVHETIPSESPSLPPPTPTYEIPSATPVGYPAPTSFPEVQGAHTSIIPLADSLLPL